MKKAILLIITLLIMGVATLNAQMRVGFMNPQEVLDQLPEREVIEQQLNRWLDQKEQEFEELAMEFQTRMADFQQQAPNMTNSQVQSEQRQLQVLNQQVEEFQVRTERELQRRQSELLAPVLREMNRIIEEVAKEIGLTYVLNEATSNGELLLLHISTSGQQYKLTDLVLQRMLN